MAHYLSHTTFAHTPFIVTGRCRIMENACDERYSPFHQPITPPQAKMDLQRASPRLPGRSDTPMTPPSTDGQTGSMKDSPVQLASHRDSVIGARSRGSSADSTHKHVHLPRPMEPCVAEPEWIRRRVLPQLPGNGSLAKRRPDSMQLAAYPSPHDVAYARSSSHIGPIRTSPGSSPVSPKTLGPSGRQFDLSYRGSSPIRSTDQSTLGHFSGPHGQSMPRPILPRPNPGPPQNVTSVFNPTPVVGHGPLPPSLLMSSSQGPLSVSEYVPKTSELRQKLSEQKKRPALPNGAIREFMCWFDNNLGEPYPGEEMRQHWEHKWKLNQTQVSNWFINYRRRNRKYLRKTAGGKSFFLKPRDAEAGEGNPAA